MEDKNNSTVESFFVKIGRGIKKGFLGLINWIKNTAWIQPLLIVGVIFAAILCIKPVINRVGEIFNPDESFVFYRENKTTMEKAKEKALEQKDGTVILIFYADSNSACTSVEKSIKNFQASHSNEKVSWYAIDCDGNDTDKIDGKPTTEQDEIIDEFTNTFYEDYAITYENGPECLKSSSHSTLEIGTGKNAIPTPMMARYDNGELVGVKIELSTSKTADDLDNFVLGSVSEDWPTFELK